MTSSQLRVSFLGLRGFPGIQGGVETHAEHLCPLLVSLGCEVEVLVRSPYVKKGTTSSWKGVKFTRIWAPRSHIFEAISHSILGVLYASLISRPHILHIHAVGPAIVAPIAKLFCLRVVVTHHGPDYDRQKWGRIAKAVLRLGERMGMRYSDKRIVISSVISNLVLEKYRIDSVIIPNGVTPRPRISSSSTLERFGLKQGRYVLLVSRLVPEKRHLDLLNAFARSAIPGWRLAFVGGADHQSLYESELKNAATAFDGVVFTGVLTGDSLSDLYSSAGVFVLPSSHEGLPISLLEALSYGLPVIASDIPANRAVGLPSSCYFPLGDIDELSRRLLSVTQQEHSELQRKLTVDWVQERYDWNKIAKSTLSVYESALQ